VSPPATNRQVNGYVQGIGHPHDALEPVIDAFAITFSDRWPDAETY
jgi:hypothetical protein